MSESSPQRLLYAFGVGPHQAEIGRAVFQVLGADGVAGVEQALFAARILADHIRHLFIGILDIEHRGRVLPAHTVDEKGDRAGGGLGVVGAAGKGREIVQTVFLHEIARGEAIGEDQAVSARRGDDAAEGRVELVELRAVALTVPAVLFRSCLVERAELPADRAADDGGVARRGPDVFVVFDLVLPAFFLMDALHALLVLFLQRVDAIEHRKHGESSVRSVEQRVEPGLGFAAVADQQIAALDAQEVLRRGLIAVRFRAGRNEQHDLAAAAAELPRKVVSREQRRDDRETCIRLSFRVRRRALRAAGGKAEEQYEREQRGEDLSFHITHQNLILQHFTGLCKT